MKKTILNPVFNDTVTFVQTCAESIGRITDIEVTLMPKGRNILHCHAYTEKFTAIDGDLGLENEKLKAIDGDLGLENEKKQQKILKSGESHTVEPMAWHCFFNPTDREIRFGVQLEPGNEKFEYFLRILYGLAADGLTDKKSRPKSIKQAAILLNMADAKMTGLLSLMSPLLRGVAKRAKANGDEQKLIDKYCV